MMPFAYRLKVRLGDAARIHQGVVDERNIASPESIKSLREEIAVKVSANEAMCNKSIEIASRMPLK